MLVLFTVLGGPVGGLSLAIAALVMEPSQIDEFGPVYVWAFPFYGFFIGLIPAFIGGGIYSMLPLNMQRIAIAPIVGFVVSLGFALAVEAIVFASTDKALARVPAIASQLLRRDMGEEELRVILAACASAKGFPSIGEAITELTPDVTKRLLDDWRYQ